MESPVSTKPTRFDGSRRTANPIVLVLGAPVGLIAHSLVSDLIGDFPPGFKPAGLDSASPPLTVAFLALVSIDVKQEKLAFVQNHFQVVRLGAVRVFLR